MGNGIAVFQNFPDGFGYEYAHPYCTRRVGTPLLDQCLRYTSTRFRAAKQALHSHAPVLTHLRIVEQVGTLEACPGVNSVVRTHMRDVVNQKFQC